ncbi:MAG TPA: hypothetical protein DHM90_11110 [Clostridiaceae bacterium]|nr:hypothetical protein [Clostridiaceae bacterium]
MKKYDMYYITHEGEILAPDKTEGISWKMKNLLNGRDSSLDYKADNMYKIQQEAMREWIMKMKW